MLADVKARVAAAVAAREAAVKAGAAPDVVPAKPAVTPSREKVLCCRRLNHVPKRPGQVHV